MKEPKNQHALVLWYLYHFPPFSLRHVINDSMFIKFQTRLSELERNHGLIAKRHRTSFTNKFGKKGSYYQYSAIDKNRIKELYKEYNKE